MKGYVPVRMMPGPNDELDRLLEFAIIHLLHTRQPFAVLDVSEAAMAIGGDAGSALVARARATARRLAKAGVIEFVDRTESVLRGAPADRVRLRRGGRRFGRAPKLVNLN